MVDHLVSCKDAHATVDGNDQSQLNMNISVDLYGKQCQNRIGEFYACGFYTHKQSGWCLSIITSLVGTLCTLRLQFFRINLVDFE